MSTAAPPDTEVDGGTDGAGGDQMPAGRHVNGLSGVRIVGTTDYRRVQIIGKQIVNNALIGAVFGPAGAGKTFAVDQFVRHTRTRDDDLQIAYVEIPHNPRGKALPVHLLNTLVGGCGDDTEDQLLEDVISLATERPTLLVIDEAHHLRTHGLHQVKYIYDTATAQRAGDPTLSVLLVGGNRLPDVLMDDKQLESRVARWVRFRHLDEADLLEVLDRYHPIFAATDDHILRDLNQRLCDGNFRHWAYTLQFALDAPGQPDHITPKLADAIVETLSARQ